jgi:hypothetical protein
MGINAIRKVKKSSGGIVAITGQVSEESKESAGEEDWSSSDSL